LGIWGFGDLGIWGFGDLGDLGIWGFGDLGIWGFGDLGIWGFGDLGIWGFGDLGIWGFGDLGIWGLWMDHGVTPQELNICKKMAACDDTPPHRNDHYETQIYHGEGQGWGKGSIFPDGSSNTDAAGFDPIIIIHEPNGIQPDDCWKFQGFIFSQWIVLEPVNRLIL
jgi:hypothetical protein